MYDKYFLSKEQLKVINNFSSEQLLIIYGDSGVGKTKLSKEILNDRMITLIDSLYLKNNTNLYEYLLNIIQKKNITMMFMKNKLKRGIIIDNLEIFHKYDKKCYKSIMDLLLTGQFYGTKIIVTCNTKFINHRSLSKLKYSTIYLNYDKHLFHKIANNICIDQKKHVSFAKRNQLLFESNYNLTTFHSLLNNCDNNSPINSTSIRINDNFDSVKVLTKKIITEEVNIKDIIRLYTGDKITISLNLLENIFFYIQDLRTLSIIYNNYVLADIIDTSCINYPDMDPYYCVFTIYPIYLFLRKIQNNQYYSIKNNNYISRSLIHVYYIKITSTYTTNEILIYPYLYAIHKKDTLKFDDSLIIQYLFQIKKKELEYYIKSFNYFYDAKININKINKLLKK